MVTAAADEYDPAPGNNQWARATYVTPTDLTCDGHRVTVLGTAGDDTLVGTPFADVIAGLGGNDTISGLSGDDRICGGDGADTISGGDGDDRIYGEGGDDQINGGPADDTCDGGTGANVLDLCETRLAAPAHVVRSVQGTRPTGVLPVPASPPAR
jgi:Ca2+-binding RTX toxin-like protein